MIASRETAVLIALAAAQVGVLVRSPLTADAPVHSCHVAVPSVVLPPREVVHVASVVFAVVPATMQTNTRSLPTAGAVNCRRKTPAATAVFCGRTVTA